MHLFKANYLHLYRAALELSRSDREEMDRLEAGRDPINVLTASSDDPTVMHISDDTGNVLAVGGHADRLIWFVHTERAVRLGSQDKLRMLRLLSNHLVTIKRAAAQQEPGAYFHFTNVVSVSNTAHIKLLNFLGAVWAAKPFHINGHEFRQFFF